MYLGLAASKHMRPLCRRSSRILLNTVHTRSNHSAPNRKSSEEKPEIFTKVADKKDARTRRRDLEVSPFFSMQNGSGILKPRFLALPPN
jgi:hypothetical protein